MTQIIRTLLRPFTFRGKARLLQSLSPKVGEQTVEIYGYRIKLDLRDYIQRSIYLHTFEPHESSLVQNYLKRGMTFVDVGANVGYYSLMASSIVGPKGRVIAFEPSPYASGRLRETVLENGVTNIEVVQAGLAERDGQIELYIGKSGRNHTPTMIPNEGGYPVTVPIQRLDDYLASRQIEHIDLITTGLVPRKLAAIDWMSEQVHP